MACDYIDLKKQFLANPYYLSLQRDERVYINDPVCQEFMRIGEELKNHPLQFGPIEFKEACKRDIEAAYNEDIKQLNRYYAMGRGKDLRSAKNIDIAVKYYSEEGLIEEYKADKGNEKKLDRFKKEVTNGLNEEEKKVADKLWKGVDELNEEERKTADRIQKALDKKIASALANQFFYSVDPRCIYTKVEIPEEEKEGRWVSLMRRRARGNVISRAHKVENRGTNATKNRIDSYIEQKNFAALGSFALELLSVDIETLSNDMLKQPGLYLVRVAQLKALGDYLDVIAEHLPQTKLSPQQLSDICMACDMTKEIYRKYHNDIEYNEKGDCYFDEGDMADESYISGLDDYIRVHQNTADEKEMRYVQSLNKREDEMKGALKAQKSMDELMKNARVNREDIVLRSILDTVKKNRRPGDITYDKAGFASHKKQRLTYLDKAIDTIETFIKGEKKRDRDSDRQQSLEEKLEALKKERRKVKSIKYAQGFREAMDEVSLDMAEKLKGISATYTKGMLTITEEEFNKGKQDAAARILEFITVYDRQLAIADISNEEREHITGLKNDASKRLQQANDITWEGYMEAVRFGRISSWKELTDYDPQILARRQSEKNAYNQTLADYQTDEEQNGRIFVEATDEKRTEAANSLEEAAADNVMHIAQNSLKNKLNGIFSLDDDAFQELSEENDNDWAKMTGKVTGENKSAEEMINEIFSGVNSGISVENMKLYKRFRTFNAGFYNRSLNLGAQDTIPLAEYADRIIGDRAFATSMGVSEELFGQLQEFTKEINEMTMLAVQIYMLGNATDTKLIVLDQNASQQKTDMAQTINDHYKRIRDEVRSERERLFSVKFTSFSKRLLTLLMDNNVKVEYDVEGKKKNYEPELAIYEKYAPLTDTKDIRIGGNTFTMNSSLTLPEGVALKEGTNEKEFAELLKTHNEYMSKVKLLDMALQEKPISLDKDKIPEEDKKAVKSAEGLWDAGLRSFTGIIRKENYAKKAKELEQRILGCLKQNG
jgi:hypothetical protein